MATFRSNVRIPLLVIATLGFGWLTWMALNQVELDNNDPLDFFPKDIPQVEGLKLYQNKFSTQYNLIIAIESKDPDAAERAAISLAEHLGSLPKEVIRRASSRPPWIIDRSITLEDGEQAVETTINPEIAELVAYLWMNQPPANVRALQERLATGNSEIALEESLEELATGLGDELGLTSFDPLGLSNLPGDSPFNRSQSDPGAISFSNEEGTFRVVYVETDIDPYDNEANLEWLTNVGGEIENWRKEFPERDKLTINQTGRAPYIAEVSTDLRSEMGTSVFLTMGIILLLFWLMHRRIIPMVCLLSCVFIVFVVTLWVGVVVYHQLNLIAASFAAILIGLVSDYGFVIFQESLELPRDRAVIRRALTGPIAWASLTTAVVFLALNGSSLPGARQLGNLVAVGIIVGAFVMVALFTFLIVKVPPPENPRPRPREREHCWIPVRFAGALTAMLLLFFGAILIGMDIPSISTSPDHFRPKNSKIWNVLSKVIAGLGSDGRKINVIVSAENDAEMLTKLRAIEEAAGDTYPHAFPTAVWPNPEHLAANREAARALAGESDRLVAEIGEIGFSDEAAQLAQRSCAWWATFGSSSEIELPNNEVSRWILNKAISREPGGTLAASGSITLPEDRSGDAALFEKFAAADAFPGGWEYLGAVLIGLIENDLYYVILPVLGLTITMLIIVFRSARSVILSLATLAFSGLALLTVMRVLEIEWHLVNVVAIPLLLGTGLDYSIHIQLAIRRLGGDHLKAQQTLGRAVLLCGATTATGFGSLAISSQAGVSSLGVVCSLGVLITMATSAVLLPAWWKMLHRD